MNDPSSKSEPEDSADSEASSTHADEFEDQDGNSRSQTRRPALNGGLGSVVEAGLSGESVSARGVLAALGGWQGVAESLLPATVYLIVYIFTRDARLSAIAPLLLAVLALAWRLIRKEPVTAALSGIVGVIICVAAVMFSGEGSSYFVPGFFINGAWILAHTVSLLVGWPLIGLLLGFLRGSLTEWRKVSALRHAAQLCTVIWIVIFASRLAVQLPLFFAAPPIGTDPAATDALGIARLVMGVPLFGLAVLVTWLVLSRVSSTVDSEKKTKTSEETESSDE